MNTMEMRVELSGNGDKTSTRSTKKLKLRWLILSLLVTDEGIISRTRQGTEKSWLDRGDDEFYWGHVKLKVLAGCSTLELMREIFSGETIHLKKIIEALELIIKWGRPKNRRLRTDLLGAPTFTEQEHTKKERQKKWNEYLGVSRKSLREEV